MQFKSLSLVALFFLTIFPYASASDFSDANCFPEECEVFTYRLAAEVSSELNTPVGVVLQFDFEQDIEHSKQVVESVITAEISQSLSWFNNNNGVYRIYAEIDGSMIPGCEWFVKTTANIPVGNRLSHEEFVVFCDVAVNLTDDEKLRTFTIIREVFSGSPDPIESNVISTILIREDVALTTKTTAFESLTGLSALEFALFPAIAFLGVILWSRAQDGAVRVFGAVLTILSGALLLAFAVFIGIGDAWFGTVAFASLMMLVGVYLIIRFMLEFIDVKGVFR